MTTKLPSPLLGYNNNVRHKGKVFHVQTEDSGVKYGHIITHLFMDGGRILKSVKTSYSEYFENDRMGEIVREMMKQQHKAMFIALRDGKFDAIIDGTAEPAQPTQAFPAAPPVVVGSTDSPIAAPLTRTPEPPGVRPTTGRAAPAPAAAPSFATAGTAAPAPEAAAAGPRPPEGSASRMLDSAVSRAAIGTAKTSPAQPAAKVSGLTPAPAVAKSGLTPSPAAARAIPREDAGPGTLRGDPTLHAGERRPDELPVDTRAVERAAAPGTAPESVRGAVDLPPPPPSLFREKTAAGKYRMTSTPAQPRPAAGRPPSSAPIPAAAVARGAASGERRYAPTRPASIFGQARPQQGKSIFGEDLISDKSLDEVILSYLAEDLEGDIDNKK